MKIVRYDNDGPAWGILDGDKVMAAEGVPFQDLTPTSVAGRLDEIRLLAPVEPRTVMCVGRNYKAHAEEFGNEVPERPILFMKPPSSVIGPGEQIVYPPQSQRVDPEAELVAVIGKRAHQVSRADAMEFIGGFTCGNDVTARDLQKTDPGQQWTRGKGFATFCPIGPWVETDFDASDVGVTCTVDGETRQDGRTSAFIFDLPFLVEYISNFMVLEPGDLIMTGTPEGVAPVEVGAEITVAVEGLGTLTNTVVAPS
ncbi:MAG: fumarylacetoacetate hydrolase family protein [Nitriliruptor sp.]|uniref:fumarylacetoacetate hydrolase family protein n=1 Tax=Nitriliruptor sp. TaxID=2448056 RepID=UPI00349FEF79